MKKAYLIFAASIAVSLFTASPVMGWSIDGEVPWRRLDPSVVTPHRSFANPAAGILPKMLVLGYGIGQREILELKQRVDYDFISLPMFNDYTFKPFEKGHRDPAGGTLYSPAMTEEEYNKELEDILARLPECDAIMLCKLPFAKLPADVASKIMDRVNAGASFIVINYDGRSQNIPDVKLEETKIAFPTEAVPPLRNVLVQKGAYGNGKVMTIKYANDFGGDPIENIAPMESDHPLFYDYCLAFVGKCLWTMVCPERFCIAEVSGDGNVWIPALPKEASTIVFEVADKYGQVVSSGTVNAADQLTLQLGKLPASARMLDVKVLDGDGKVIDFQCAPVTEQAKLISKMSLEKECLFPDEPLAGEIALLEAVKGTLQLTVTDDYGRILVNSSSAIKGDSRKFKFNLFHQNSHYASVAAKLYDADGALLDEARRDIFFNTSAEQSDFAFGMWSYSAYRCRVNALWLRSMSDAGIDFLMETSLQHAGKFRQYIAPRNCKRNGMNYAVYITRLVGNQWTDAGKCPYGFWEQYQNTGNVVDDNGVPFDGATNFLNVVKSTKDIGAVFYNLGDENTLSLSNTDKGNCFCAACQRRFQEYLAKRYGTIAALNKEYGTEFADFSEVNAMDLEEAKATGQSARWVDHRLFMEEQFINWHLYKRDLIRSLDATSRVGLEGMTYPERSIGGFNFPKMLPHFEFCAPYLNTREAHALKYLSKDNSLKSAWFGTYTGSMREQNMRQRTWKNLFSGLGGAFYWYSGIPYNTSSFTTSCISSPDLKLLSQFTSAAEEVATIKNTGVGQLLMNSKMANDGIWVHYSNNSLHTDTFSQDSAAWERSHKSFEMLLDSMAVGFEYASPEEIEAGIPDGIRMLILPHSQAMSPAEVKAVRNFVARGGALVADYRPAVADGHGKFLEKSQLEDIFGGFEKLHAKTYGNGMAIYLDDYLAAVPLQVQNGNVTGLQKGMYHLLAKAGVAPFARVTSPDGRIQDGTVFENGTDKYLCILAPRSDDKDSDIVSDGPEGATAALTSGNVFKRDILLSKPMYVHDMLNGGKCIGCVREFSVELKPALGHVYACTEFEVPAPQIKASSKKAEYGKPISFRFKDIHNVALFEVRNPAGEIVYSRRVSDGKEDSARFVPAFNDAEGLYTATIRNAIGAKETSCKFILKK